MVYNESVEAPSTIGLLQTVELLIALNEYELVFDFTFYRDKHKMIHRLISCEDHLVRLLTIRFYCFEWHFSGVLIQQLRIDSGPKWFFVWILYHDLVSFSL